MLSQVNNGQMRRRRGWLFECVLECLCPTCHLMVSLLCWALGSKRHDWQQIEARPYLLECSDC